jgi:NitT/TauT family transport system substrate-binding protein
MVMRLRLVILLTICIAGAATPLRAEIGEITAAQQYGVSFLPMMLMERDGLVEKHANRAGIAAPKVNWIKVAGPSVMNDGLISGTMHFAALGPPSLITLWSKTKGNIGVMGVAAMTSYPLYLNTRDPDVKSIRDFTAKDKIAVPSIKISTQAIMLQMAAAQEWGEASWARLDALTISLSHPDGLIAFINNTAGINTHFTTSPFHEQEAKIPGVRTITTNYEILGGRATAVVVASTSKFRAANPEIFRAFGAALAEAIETINRDKRAAAQIYLDMAKDTKNSADDIYAVISNPDYAFTLTPEKVDKIAAFLAKIGSIKEAPRSWKDLFFPEIHNLPGD